MSKSQAEVNESFEDLEYNEGEVGVDFADDPFEYTQAIFIPKTQFVDLRIPFEVIGVETKTTMSPKYGEKHEHHLTIRYPDRKSGELRTGVVNYAVGNSKGETTNRDRATYAIAAGLKAGKRYQNYYLTGGGSGFTLTKQLPL